MFGVTNMDKTLNKLDEMKFVVFLIFVSMLHHKLLFFEKKNRRYFADTTENVFLDYATFFLMMTSFYY